MTHSDYAHLIEEAEQQVWVGNASAAQQLFAQAAEDAWEFVQTLASDHPQSVAVYGCEALSLYQRAGDAEQAQAVGRFLLEQPSLKPYDHETVQRMLRTG